MNLHLRLTSAFIAIVTIPMIALILVNDQMIKNTISNAYKIEIDNVIKQYSDYTFEELKTSIQNYIFFVAKDSNLIKAAYYANIIDSKEDLRTVLHDFKTNLSLSYLEVTNRDGLVTYSTIEDGLNNERQLKKIKPHSAKSAAIFEYSQGLGLYTIHSSEKIIRSGKHIGYLHGGYMLDGKFIAKISEHYGLTLFEPGSGKFFSNKNVDFDKAKVIAII